MPIQADTLSRLWHTRLQQMVLPLLLVTMIGCNTECQGVRVNYSTVFLQTQAEFDCNVIGEVFVVRCPDCRTLPLDNSTFGWGEGTNRLPWQGDQAVIVEGQTENITPCHTNRMLRFEASHATDPGASDNASTTYQVIDLRQTPLAEDVTFLARALVNRRQVDAETDRTFRLSVIAYAGNPTTFDPASTDHRQLGGNMTLLAADNQTDTWEAMFTELRFRSTDIDFLLVTIAALEDVMDDPGTADEFDAHFVDYVQVGYTEASYDLGLAFRTWPISVSPEGMVVFELALTNHTPNIIVNGAGVATEFRGTSFVSISTDDNSSRLVLNYLDHTGEGMYDPEQGIWYVDRLDGGATVKLYIAMHVTQVARFTLATWQTTATILQGPGDQNLGNNQRTASLRAPFVTQVTPPAIALSDTTMAVGDTLSIYLFQGGLPLSSSSETVLSHPTVATTSFVEDNPGTSYRYHLQVIGEAPGETTIVVSLHALNGFTANFFDLTVTPADTPPVAQDDTYAVEMGQTLTVEAPGILANDSDVEGERLVAVLETPPASGTLTLEEDGGFTYVPDASSSGDVFTYRATDEEQGGVQTSELATVTLTLVQSNRRPVATADTFEVEGNTSTVLDLLANDSDPDGDPLTIVASSPNTVENGTTEVINNGQAVRYTPESGFIGTDTFYYVIRDSQGLSSATETPVTVMVANSNRPPTISAPINDITVSPDPPTSCSFDLDDHFSDPDGDALSYRASQSGGNANVNINGSNVTISGSGLNQATVTITAEDTEGLTVSDNFSVQKVLSVTDCGGNRTAR